MNNPVFFDSKRSLNLFGLGKDFSFISTLYEKKKLPKVLMLSGEKGSGKSTLINHFLFSIFDKENYDKKNFSLLDNSNFFKQFNNNIFPNIIYIQGADYNSVKIEEIRNLKSNILKSTISSEDRFIILDDIELFNQNSLNALLKTIEEPSKKNYFLLIYNKSKPLLETIKSRALEKKIILNEKQRLETIKKLVNFYKVELILDPETSQLSPGNFIRFNYLCHEHKILPTRDFIANLSILLSLYKKNKDVLFINLLLFITDYYFKNLKEKNLIQNEKVFETKDYIFKNLNYFMTYNTNQNSLINIISKKIKI